MRRYDNWLKAYIHHTRFSESPDQFHLWTGIATIAGALRRRVWIDQLHFQWTPNFYIVLVGPPGIAAKSTSIRSGLGLLERIPGVFFGPQSMTWQALLDCFKNAQEGVEIPNRSEPEIMSCLNIGVSELGTFLRPDNAELVDFLVAIWDGQKEVLRRQTKGSGEIVINNPWLNLIACTTPAWLKENFPDVLVGGGLTSRMVFVYADTKRQYIAYPADHVPSSTYAREESELLHDLQEIAEIKGEYTFTAAAKTWGQAWYENHWRTAPPEYLQGNRFEGYRARKQTHLHKVAMVLAAAQRNDRILTDEDLIAAEQILQTTELDLQKVFSSIGVSEAANVNLEILSLMKNLKEVKYTKLWQLCFNRLSAREFADGLKAAIDAGYITMQNITDPVTQKPDRILRYVRKK